jgi:TPP-dependent pyruvate/acetoin dehydrogenase alpha subunit
MLQTLVGGLLNHPKRLAVVPTLALSEPAWQNLLRFAGRHRIPILFIVPGRIAGRRDSTDLRTIYAEYGVPVMTVDASDPIAAFRVATEAAHNARAGRGATVLEAVVVETQNSSVNSQHPLEHLEDYMRRRGSWSDEWQAEVVRSAHEAMKAELSA